MLRSFILETVAAPGTSAFTLLGGAFGRRAFNGTGAFASGSTVYYVADNNAGAWEEGWGVASTGSPNNTLTRNVLANSLGTTAKINFTGAVDVFCALPASRAILLNKDGVPIDGLGNRPVGRGALVKLTTNLSIANNTATAVTWSSAEYDDASLWSAGNPTRLTVPAGGWTRARLSANLGWQSSTSGRRVMEIRKNGASTAWGLPLVHVPVTSNARTNMNGTTAVSGVTVTAGDYFEVWVTQNSGVALNLQGGTGEVENWFSMELVA